ncbi:phage tail family protein [Evansella cellulosilytica]|uniref:Siphovirus-type tail component RIFT-related domain-containing protein n=1 Tax=Evansella cellulosilytica (strain ATCC 21833 / DSM 2522 / FERM P-1141 / JCM 9156 / N-4) TaxID=649639 RepID=E6TVF8_EVAC2|nr:phage tail family protein [Evansella cellulosilytica]ADU30975.1 hypothetical protein Bcell_2720 [Evansella cellulosilytica DSM 2522]
MRKYDLSVIRKDTEINVLDYGITCLTFSAPLPIPRTAKEYPEGKNGYVDLGTVYEGRRIYATFLLKGENVDDYYLLINELNRIFDSREAFYVRHFRQPWKRYKVKLESPIEPQQIDRYGRINLTFESESAFAESIGTSLSPFTFDVELWGIGQGLSVDQNDYTFNSTSFVFNNIGDVALDPREWYQQYKITFKGISNNLKIRNERNGDEWQYFGSTTSQQEIVIEGVRARKNGISIFSNTCKRVLTLEPGGNEITISGTSGQIEIIFDTRFYYL